MQKKTSLLSKIIFKVLKFFAGIRYRKTKIIGIDNIPESHTIIVANHAQLNGPIIAELLMPRDTFIWANGQMTDYREVPSYAMEDFFPYKTGWVRPFYRLASYILAPLMPCVINNARAIPVYHDLRIASTMRSTVKLLAEGKNIMIFPENHEVRNNIVNQFRDRYIDVARLYYKRYGIKLSFLPMYIAPSLNSCYFGEAVVFDPEADITEERHRISEHLVDQITQIGRSLPEHTVIPFDNISRKFYLSNKDIEATPQKR